MSDEKDRVFISYATEDYEMAEKLYDDLKKEDINVFLDKKDLLPGQNWEKVIQQVIRKSSCFISLISNDSLKKRGFVQREQQIAFEVADKVPEDEIFIIPLTLGDVNIDKLPEQMKTIHQTDISGNNYEKGLKQILSVIPQGEKIDRINVLIVSMKECEADELLKDEAKELLKTDKKLLSIFNKDDIPKCYSGSRDGWKPYAGHPSYIGSLINKSIKRLNLLPVPCSDDFFNDKIQVKKWDELRNRKSEYLIIIADALSLLNYKLRDDLHQASLWWGERIRICILITNCDEKDEIKKQIKSWLKIPCYKNLCKIVETYEDDITLIQWLEDIISDAKKKNDETNFDSTWRQGKKQ